MKTFYLIRIGKIISLYNKIAFMNLHQKSIYNDKSKTVPPIQIFILYFNFLAHIVYSYLASKSSLFSLMVNFSMYK
jgi:hypothetical protein